jgi:SAM-dependent methyltransferase
MTSFDGAYRAEEGYFGSHPEPILAGHLDALDDGVRVLDIGCGQGRNALFLARTGFPVDALDPSPVAIQQVAKAAGDRDLPIRTILGTFQDLTPANAGYGAVLAFGLIPLLSRTEIIALVGAVTSALRSGGLVFVTAFGTWDPAYPRHASQWREVGVNSFRGSKGDLRTYLEPGELRRLFSEFDEVHLWEGHGREHRHDSGPTERHGMAEAVFRR